MTLIDIGIIVVLLVSTIISYFRGLFKEAVGLLTLVAAFVIATLYAQQLGSLFRDHVDGDLARGVVAWVILFVGIYLIGSLIRFLFSKLREQSSLSMLDRLMGCLFGFLRGVLLVGLIVLIAHLDVFSSIRDGEIWNVSRVLPVFVEIAESLHGLLPPKEGAYFDFG